MNEHQLPSTKTCLMLARPDAGTTACTVNLPIGLPVPSAQPLELDMERKCLVWIQTGGFDRNCSRTGLFPLCFAF